MERNVELQTVDHYFASRPADNEQNMVRTIEAAELIGIPPSLENDAQLYDVMEVLFAEGDYEGVFYVVQNASFADDFCLLGYTIDEVVTRLMMNEEFDFALMFLLAMEDKIELFESRIGETISLVEIQSAKAEILRRRAEIAVMMKKDD